jgi:DNA-binding NtrC family response regulator
VQIDMPALRERKGDIHLLFRKFAIDFAEKYRMPELELEPSAIHYIENYAFPGNVRQLRNLVEQMTVVERNRNLTVEKLAEYIPMETHLPMVVNTPNSQKQNDFGSEREIMYKILFDMRNDINDLKSLTSELIKNRGTADLSNQEKNLINRIYTPENQQAVAPSSSLLYFEDNNPVVQTPTIISNSEDHYEDFEDIEIEDDKPESLSLQNNEKDLIIKALEKHKGRRNKAADELGISQRTLYRKIKQYNLEE